MAKITKHISHSYEVITAIASKPAFVFGKFIEARKRHGLSTSTWEHCFGCGHHFADEENVYFGAVQEKGNVFFCKACADEYCTEEKT